TYPRLAVENQTPADAGSPEDAEQRVIRTARAEVELGLGSHLDVVADEHLCSKLRGQRRPQLERAVPPGKVARAGDCSGGLVDDTRGSDADALQRRRVETGGLSGLAHRVEDRVRHVGRLASGWGGPARPAEHVVAGVDDDRLDLGAA